MDALPLAKEVHGSSMKSVHEGTLSAEEMAMVAAFREQKTQAKGTDNGGHVTGPHGTPGLTTTSDMVIEPQCAQGLQTVQFREAGSVMASNKARGQGVIDATLPQPQTSIGTILLNSPKNNVSGGAQTLVGTTSETSQSQSKVMPLYNPRPATAKGLLIFELEGVLCWTQPVTESMPNSIFPCVETPSIRVYLREDVKTFLAVIQSHFDVAVWSDETPQVTHQTTACVFARMEPPKFVWNVTHCRVRNMNDPFKHGTPWFGKP